MIDLATNVLYYCDNLDILHRYLPDAAVDLVELDPPFNSNRDYNVIFRDELGNATDAQLLAKAMMQADTHPTADGGSGE
jgi:site-specific DNA-methyltransferase (adenine-specific)